MRHVLNYGSINLDHVYRVPHLVNPGETLTSRSLTTGLGGKGANQSVAIARAGSQVKHVGQIGVADHWAVTMLDEAGVDTSYISSIDSASGHAIIQVDDQGENAIVLHGGANQSCDLQLLAAGLADAPVFFLTQNECNDVSSAIDLAHRAAVPVIYNPAPMIDTCKEVDFCGLHSLIVNQSEAQALFGDLSMDKLAEHCHNALANVRVILTLGAQGAELFYQSKHWHLDAAPCEVVDTTAAGDTYVGYYVAGLLQGMTLMDSLGFAAEAAALTVSKAGAISAIPSADEVRNA